MADETTRTIVAGLAGVVVGVVIDRWWADRSDRNVAYNDIADPIRLRFEKQAASPSLRARVLGDDVLLLRNHMSARQQKQYDKALAQYHSATGVSNQQPNAIHEMEIINPALVTQACDEVLNTIPRR